MVEFKVSNGKSTNSQETITLTAISEEMNSFVSPDVTTEESITDNSGEFSLDLDLAFPHSDNNEDHAAEHSIDDTREFNREELLESVESVKSSLIREFSEREKEQHSPEEFDILKNLDIKCDSVDSEMGDEIEPEDIFSIEPVEIHETETAAEASNSQQAPIETIEEVDEAEPEEGEEIAAIETIVEVEEAEPEEIEEIAAIETIEEVDEAEPEEIEEVASIETIEEIDEAKPEEIKEIAAIETIEEVDEAVPGEIAAIETIEEVDEAEPEEIEEIAAIETIEEVEEAEQEEIASIETVEETENEEIYLTIEKSDMDMEEKVSSEEIVEKPLFTGNQPERVKPKSATLLFLFELITFLLYPLFSLINGGGVQDYMVVHLEFAPLFFILFTLLTAIILAKNSIAESSRSFPILLGFNSAICIAFAVAWAILTKSNLLF